MPEYFWSAASALDVDRDLDRIFLLRPDTSVPDVYAQLLSHPVYTGGRFGTGANHRSGGRSRCSREALAKSRVDCFSVFAIGYQAWIARSDLVAQADDYRREPAYWENIEKAIPANANLIGLTQDYGYRLMYYGWRKITLWPYVNGLTAVKGTSINAQAKFSELVAGQDYFLVSASNQSDAQPELKKILDGYTVTEQGNGMCCTICINLNRTRNNAFAFHKLFFPLSRHFQPV